MQFMKRFILLFLFLFWFGASRSQVQDSSLFGAYESIKSEDLKEIVYALASPKMEGRGVGTDGIQKAAHYISNGLRRNGIGFIPALDGYEQKVDFPYFRLEKPIVTIGKVNCNENSDYLGSISTFSCKRVLDIVIVKNTSIDYIQELDLKNRVILILTSDIFFVKKPLYDVLIKKGCSGVILCNPKNNVEFNNLSKIFSTQGAKKDKYKISFSGSLLKTDSLLKSLRFKGYYISTLVVPPRIVSKVLGLDMKAIIAKLDSKGVDSTFFKMKKVGISVKQDIIEDNLTSHNILGFIEGNDLKEEVIVISAHYDHLGTELGRVMYGADDNASGVASILEVAEAYSIAIKNGFKPKRSIIFAAFTAEEKGLWGSRVFVNKLDGLNLKPIVNLNADMVGRGEDSRMELNSKIKKLYVIAERKDSLLLKKIKQIHLDQDSLHLDYSSTDKYSSDQASFMHRGHSAVLFFRGLHPDYHTERDTPDKLDYITMERITRLIFRLSLDYSK